MNKNKWGAGEVWQMQKKKKEPCPPVDGRKEEINTSSAWGLPL